MLHLICYFWTLRIETFNRLTRARALSNELLNYHSDVERAKKKAAEKKSFIKVQRF